MCHGHCIAIKMQLKNICQYSVFYTIPLGHGHIAWGGGGGGRGYIKNIPAAPAIIRAQCNTCKPWDQKERVNQAKNGVSKQSGTLAC